MVVDTSALVAILQQEPEAETFARLIEESSTRLVSAATVLEAGMVAEVRCGKRGADELDHLLLRARFDIVPFDSEQAVIAREAFRRFGKGRHRAGLNLGDCFAYALAKTSGEPLLYKGEDFSETDVASCS